MGTKEKCAAGLLLIGDLCPLPADAAGDVGDLHALGLQLIADTVGLGDELKAQDRKSTRLNSSHL